MKVREYLGASQWDFAEVVVVDDGSQRRHGPKLARDAGVRVLQNPGNRGKGYSVKHGMLEAKGEWALFTDADLSSPIGEVEKLWSAVEREGAQVAIGSRAVDRSLVGVHQPLLREAVGRVFNVAMRVVTGLPFKDTQCGFKLFQTSAGREVFSRQRLDGFGFDVEVLFIAQETRVSSGGSSGAVGQRGGHQGEPAARVQGLPGPVESPRERAAGEVQVEKRVLAKALRSQRRRRQRYHSPPLSVSNLRSRVLARNVLVCQTLMMTSRRRSRVRKNLTLSKRPNSFSRLRLLYNCVGRRMPCCKTSSEFNWAMRNV